jgi:hypothetical protein
MGKRWKQRLKQRSEELSMRIAYRESSTTVTTRHKRRALRGNGTKIGWDTINNQPQGGLLPKTEDKRGSIQRERVHQAKE